MPIEYKCICEIHPQCKADRHRPGGSSPVHGIVMAQELFNALSMLLNCHGDYSHINCGSFDLLTDGESYDNAVDVLKKYHDILSP